MRNVKRSFLAQTKIISNGIVAVCKEIKSLEVENMCVNIKHIFTFLISLKDNYLLKAKMAKFYNIGVRKVYAKISTPYHIRYDDRNLQQFISYMLLLSVPSHARVPSLSGFLLLFMSSIIPTCNSLPIVLICFTCMYLSSRQYCQTPSFHPYKSECVIRFGSCVCLSLSFSVARTRDTLVSATLI